MSVSHDQLDAFHRFASQRLGNGGAESLQELLDEWRILNPTPAEHARNVAASNAAIRDLENGDFGIPVKEQIRQLRQKYNIASEA